MANMRRAANRRGAKRIAAREPEHNEAAYAGRMSAHMSHASPASMGASKGPGPLPGAGMLPARGPGPAAQRKIGMSKEAYPSRPTPDGNPPRGMSVYREE